MAETGLGPAQQALRDAQMGVGLKGTGPKPFLGLFGQRAITDSDLNAFEMLRDGPLTNEAGIEVAAEEARVAERNRQARQAQTDAANKAAQKRVSELRKKTPEAKARAKEEEKKAKAKAKADARAKWRASVGRGAGWLSFGAFLATTAPALYRELTREGDIAPEDMPTPEEIKALDISAATGDDQAERDFYDIMATASMGGDPSLLRPEQLRDVGLILQDAEANPDDYGDAVIDGLRTLSAAAGQVMLASDGTGLTDSQLQDFKTPGRGIDGGGEPEGVTSVDRGIASLADVLTYDQTQNLIEGLDLSGPIRQWAMDRIASRGSDRDIPRALAVEIANAAQALEEQGVTAQDLRGVAGDIPGAVAGAKAGAALGARMPGGAIGKGIGVIGGGLGGAVAGATGVNALQDGLDPWLKEQGINPDIVEGALQVGGAGLTAKAALSALPSLVSPAGGALVAAGIPTAANADEVQEIGPDANPGFIDRWRDKLGIGEPLRRLSLPPMIVEAIASDPVASAEVQQLLESGDTQGAAEFAMAAGETILGSQARTPTAGPRMDAADPAALMPAAVQSAAPQVPLDIPSAPPVPYSPSGTDAPEGFGAWGEGPQGMPAAAARGVAPLSAPALPDAGPAQEPERVLPASSVSEVDDEEDEARATAAEGLIDVADLGIGRPRTSPAAPGAGIDDAPAASVAPTQAVDTRLPSGIDSVPLAPATAEAAGLAARTAEPAVVASSDADDLVERQAAAAFAASEPQTFWEKLNSPEGQERLATGLAGFGAGIAADRSGTVLGGLNAGMTGYNIAVERQELLDEEAEAEELEYQRSLEREQRGYDHDFAMLDARRRAVSAASAADYLDNNGVPGFDDLKDVEGTTGANRRVLRRQLAEAVMQGEADSQLRADIVTEYTRINPTPLGAEDPAYEDLIRRDDAEIAIARAINNRVYKAEEMDWLQALTAGRSGL